MLKQKISKAPDKIKKLYRLASQARNLSYSPYSGCKVGAAILTSKGEFFSGCNIENSSFGATTCAERVAIQKAKSEVKSLKITEILVVTDATPPWPPCGICRQVISEFGLEANVHTVNLKGDLFSFQFKDLLPLSFDPSYLSKK